MVVRAVDSMYVVNMPVVNTVVQLQTTAVSIEEKMDDDVHDKCTICLCSFEEDERVRYVSFICHSVFNPSDGILAVRPISGSHNQLTTNLPGAVLTCHPQTSLRKLRLGVDKILKSYQDQ